MAPRCTSTCRPRSSLSSRRPTPACRATGRPAAPSRPRWRPARRSRYRCSSPPARRSRSTPAPAPTSAAPKCRCPPGDRPPAARPTAPPSYRARGQPSLHGKDRMAARSKARKRALDILFEADVRGLPTLELLSERQSVGDMPVQPFAAALVRGVASHSERIDELISWNLVDWTMERMPAVDRNILRIGVYELLWADDVPDGVAISEAVALAQDLSTDNSPPFVNGLLARIKAEKPTLSLDPEASAFSAADDSGDEEDDDYPVDDWGDDDAAPDPGRGTS